MCGICGIVARAGAPDAGAVERMAARLVHRGPDHGAVREEGSCALGYRRLNVIDLAETGQQPVTNEAGDVLAVLNGELYNFRQLRTELETRGHRIPGSGDTQVLPHLYEEHGVGFAERLEGMFALAIWDATRERLVLARDRLGKKPLVHARLDDGSFAFASEAKALLALPGLTVEPDLRALDAYLALGYVPPDRSSLRGLRKLPAAHVLVIEGEDERVERYWQPRIDTTERSVGEWLARVREEVATAVRRRLVADVPLGALLSGGIDSSIVTALMAQAGGRVRTFSIGFGDARYDEREHARMVAARYGTEHQELVVEPDAAALVPRLAQAWDEPFGDSSALPTFLVSELARREITVALTGDGGDEAFGGYERYAALALADRLPHSVAAGAAAVLGRLSQARREPRSALFRARRFADLAALAPTGRYGAVMELFPPELRGTLWSDEALAEIADVASAAELLGPNDTSVRELQLLDLRTYLAGDLLVKADIASMAHSLELRSPLLDHRVVELGLSLPDSLKVRGRTGKIALRRAFAPDLPPATVRRRKRGFGVPVSRWFRGDLRELAEDVLLDTTATSRGLFRRTAVERLVRQHDAAEADHGARLWALLMLELWQRAHVDVHAAAATPSAA